MTKYLCVIFLISLLFIHSCTTKPDQHLTELTSEPIPPYELMQSNFQQSSHVILFRLDSLKIKDRIYADDGSLGYVVFEFFGVVINKYKGDLKINQQLNYRLWVEYNSNWEKIWRTKDEFFVFLNRDKETDEFHVIEVGQFKRTSGLMKLIKTIQKEEGRDEKNF